MTINQKDRYYEILHKCVNKIKQSHLVGTCLEGLGRRRWSDCQKSLCKERPETMQASKRPWMDSGEWVLCGWGRLRDSREVVRWGDMVAWLKVEEWMWETEAEVEMWFLFPEDTSTRSTEMPNDWKSFRDSSPSQYWICYLLFRFSRPNYWHRTLFSFWDTTLHPPILCGHSHHLLGEQGAWKTGINIGFQWKKPISKRMIPCICHSQNDIIMDKEDGPVVARE